jgi:hypothetical protein
MEMMNGPFHSDVEREIWGPYPNYQDIARFEYGRRLWRHPEMRARLTNHWLDERHPYRERFLKQRQLIEKVLDSQQSSQELQRSLLDRGTTLRCMAREIPPVFGSFFPVSQKGQH